MRWKKAREREREREREGEIGRGMSKGKKRSSHPAVTQGGGGR